MRKYTACAKKIIYELNDRKGFDWWWCKLPRDIQNEIIVLIARIIQEKVG